MSFSKTLAVSLGRENEKGEVHALPGLGSDVVVVVN